MTAPLPPAQAATAADTLRQALQSVHLADAAAAVPSTEPRPADPAWPPVGTSRRRELLVGPDDTAAAMGHPDASVRVLGSPRIALWFELVASALLPDPHRT